MGHIPVVGGKSIRVRLYLLFVFGTLIVLGATMVTPFLITVSSSAANDFDYNRFSPVPRYFYSPEDRFVKGLVKYFNTYRGWADQLAANLGNVPSHWATWMTIGQDRRSVDRVADRYLQKAGNPQWQAQARDYSEFADSYPLTDTMVAVEDIQAVEFLRERYEQICIKNGEPGDRALQRLNQEYGIPFKSFYNVKFKDSEMLLPVDFQTWYPPVGTPKYDDFLRIKAAYRAHLFTPGVKAAWLDYLKKKQYSFADEQEVFPVNGQSPAALQTLWRVFKAQDAPASPAVPMALRMTWYKYLQSEDALRAVGLRADESFTVGVYNRLAGTAYTTLQQTPFPVPADFKPGIRKLWDRYVQMRYPLRLTRIEVTPQLRGKYAAFLQKEVKYLRVANELLGTNHKEWTQFELSPQAEAGEDQKVKNRRNLWMNFVKSLPPAERIQTSSEMAFQNYLLRKYGSVQKVNDTYGWSLKHIEEAFPPFDKAYAITFANHQTAFTLQPVLANYRIIAGFLTGNSKAIQVTLLLIALTLALTLTINPLAAYALSRFNMRGRDKVIMYMLATMAFPAMVSAIPAYLLMRDIGMLNTFWALLLPHAANGMAIFILKGFFDSLPQELFEAATIDGASELQIFRIVAMPLVKPILAINCLTAFICAYNGWEWALTICQREDMWTIAVWMYQASQWWKDAPWLVSAGFVVASVPTFLVFVSCQKMILKGIVIPSMK